MKRSLVASLLVPALFLQLALPGAAHAARRDKLQRYSFELPNGYVIDALAWKIPRTDGPNGRAVLRGPNGESMSFQFVRADDGSPVVVIDDSLLVHYRVAPDGRVTRVVVDDGVRAVSSVRRAGDSAVSPEAYRFLADRLVESHSPEFVEGMTTGLAALDREAMPAGLRQIIECLLSVTGYVLSIWGLVAGCSVGGAITLGASCILAIFSHETAAASAILSCLPD